MKFCKVLEGQDQCFPELSHMFLRYKALKKQIKAIPSTAHGDDAEQAEQAGPSGAAAVTTGTATEGATTEGAGACASHTLSQEEHAFIASLNEDLENFNNFFIEKEEDAVIRLQAMSEQLGQLGQASKEQRKEMKERLVNFHGELVLILHWSLINYSAVVKILKKHDKRTGLLLRAPYIANVLKQPFASTNVMSRLVKRAEELVEAAGRPPCEGGNRAAAEAAEAAQQQLWHRHPSSDDEGSSVTAVSEHPPAPRMAKAKRTELVLEMWESLAKTASTPSTILPIEAAAQGAAGGSVSHEPCGMPELVEQGGSLARGPRRADQGQPPQKRSRACAE